MREAPRIAAPRAGASGCCIPITNSGIFTPRQTHSAGHWRNKRRRSEGQGFVAQLARLQARHDSIRRAFVELKQQRQRERALERTEAERLKRRYDAAWDKFIAAFTRHWDTCRKALHPSHFDPSQPRVPAGNPDGGQWTRVAGADKPRFGRGTIAAVLAEAAKRAIEAYRTGNSLWDLFGGKIGTVTVTTIDGQQVFGSNSTSPTYEAADHAAALELRDRLIEKYPDVLNAQEVGRRPNDALFHAETTVLTRAARATGGKLAGRTIEVHVDREICPSCDKVLPLVGLELGNPTVTFVETTGRRQTMRNGSWIARDR
ncbi:MAG: hypothetical protein WAJ91_00290 [Rhodoplanes sp.]